MSISRQRRYDISQVSLNWSSQRHVSYSTQTIKFDLRKQSSEDHKMQLCNREREYSTNRRQWLKLLMSVSLYPSKMKREVCESERM